MHRVASRTLTITLLAALAASAPLKAVSFVGFESGPVRPVAMSPDGTKLFAANTPKGTLEIFSLTGAGPVFQARVPVGLEPVAVAARSNSEVWVVNHLSESVSVVTLSGTPHVVRTLLVGDEPRDIVFAGSPARAFITTAHRGQQRKDPSIAAVPGARWLHLPRRQPRAGDRLARRAGAGSRVDRQVHNITGHRQDELKRIWDNCDSFSLPDLDLFALDANRFSQTAAFAHVGTTLFNMAVNPASGHLYVSNTDAQNQVRFEGPGIFGGHTVQGHLAEARVTVISGSNVTPIHLNKHIDYAKLASTSGFDPTAKNYSLSMPLDMAVSGDGKTLYVAAFGSSKIGVFDTAALENNTFDPKTASTNYIPVSGGGPAGLALDSPRNRLYVLTRFDDAIKVIDLGSHQDIAQLAMLNPEPAAVVQGRPMLYDATRFSGNGEAACASCHIFGDMDDLAWDLGNPDHSVTANPTPINFGDVAAILLGKILFNFPGAIHGTGQSQCLSSDEGADGDANLARA